MNSPAFIVTTAMAALFGACSAGPAVSVAAGTASASAPSAATASATRPTVKRTGRGNCRFECMEKNVAQSFASVHRRNRRRFGVLTNLRLPEMVGGLLASDSA